MLEALERDIEANYEVKPIIVVAAKDDEDDVLGILKNRK